MRDLFSVSDVTRYSVLSTQSTAWWISGALSMWVEWMNHHIISEHHGNSCIVIEKYWKNIQKWRDSNSKNHQKLQPPLCPEPGCIWWSKPIEKEGNKIMSPDYKTHTKHNACLRANYSAARWMFTDRGLYEEKTHSDIFPMKRWIIKLLKNLQKVNLTCLSALNKIFCSSH